MGERIMRPQSLYILWALLTMHYNSPWICSSEDLDCRMGLRRSPILLTFEMYVLVRRVLLGVHSPSVPHPLDSESQNHTNSFVVLESPYAFFGHSTNPLSTFPGSSRSRPAWRGPRVTSAKFCLKIPIYGRLLCCSVRNLTSRFCESSRVSSIVSLEHQ